MHRLIIPIILLTAACAGRPVTTPAPSARTSASGPTALTLLGASTETVTPTEVAAIGFCGGLDWNANRWYLVRIDGVQQPWAGALLPQIGDTTGLCFQTSPAYTFAAGTHTVDVALINHCAATDTIAGCSGTAVDVTGAFASLTVVSSSPPVDCVVSEWSAWSTWSAWTSIDATTEERMQTRTRMALTPAANGGAACPPLTETNRETRAITPVRTMTAVVSIYQCRFVLVADPPDATSGWTAQFKNGTTNLGSADSNPPYTRTVYVVPGAYTLTVTWTKKNMASVISTPLAVSCQ